jgi:hypothetical protein
MAVRHPEAWVGHIEEDVDRLGLLHGWLTLFVPGMAGPEGCQHAEEVPA